MSGGAARRVVAVAAAVLGAVAALSALGAGPASAEEPAKRVVIVGIAGLTAADVANAPALARLARAGSLGSLSVRAAPDAATCPAEGWLTLASGTYAAVIDPDDVDSARGCAQRQGPEVRAASGTARIPDMPRLVELNEGLRFGATPGVLGGAGVPCVTAVGAGAALAASDAQGAVSRYEPELPADPALVLANCPLTIVDLGSLPDGVQRRAALRRADDAVARLEAARPDRTAMIVLGIGETQARQPHLHPVIAEGPGFRGGWLFSPSTRRPPYVQLSDIAPTALHALGLPAPRGIAGERLGEGGEGRPASLAGALAAIGDTDAAAVQQRRVVGWFWGGFGVLSLLVYGALAWLLRRRRLGAAVPVALLGRLGVGALALAAVPAATFLANLVPWWRASVPLLALTGAVLVAVALTVAVAYAGPWRRPPGGPATAVVAASVLVFVVDAVTHTTLQINSLLGYNPLVAGRFNGFGNIAAAAFGGAVMMLAAFLAHGRPRLRALAIVVAVAVPSIALDGATAWGNDFGGVLTFVPAFGILALLVTRSRINLLRLALAAAAGVLVVGMIGVADYLQPPESRSHFGRFVGAVVDGSAGATVLRKLRTSVDLLLMGPHTVAAFVLVVLLGVLVFRPTASLRAAYGRVPALRLALVAVVVMSVLGGATNDSSVAIPLVAALIAVPIAFALCARPAVPAAPADTPVPEVTEPAQVLP